MIIAKMPLEVLQLVFRLLHYSSRTRASRVNAFSCYQCYRCYRCCYLVLPVLPVLPLGATKCYRLVLPVLPPSSVSRCFQIVSSCIFIRFG